jgi:hypothetical protein
MYGSSYSSIPTKDGLPIVSTWANGKYLMVRQSAKGKVITYSYKIYDVQTGKCVSEILRENQLKNMIMNFLPDINNEKNMFFVTQDMSAKDIYVYKVNILDSTIEQVSKTHVDKYLYFVVLNKRCDRLIL